MEVSEYLNLLTEQIRCKRARNMIEEEIKAHIEDQAFAYHIDGIEENAAYFKAVKEMGDPVEAGTALDRIHRPKTDWRTIVLILFLSLMGIILQYVAAGYVWPDSMIANAVIGFACMAVIYFLDYTLIGKHPVIIYVIGILAVIIYNLYFQNKFSTWAAWFTIPLFAGIVYNYRGKGYKGAAGCLLWLVCTGGAFLILGKTSICCIALLFVTCMTILSFAILMGYYNIPRKAAAFIWSGSVLFPAGMMAYFLLWGATYQSDRIKGFLFPADYSATSGYTFMARSVLDKLMLAGNGGMKDITAVIPNTHSDYFFLWLMNRFGIAAGMALVAVLGLLCIHMAVKIAKQRNQLGAIVGMSCLLGIFFPAVLHIMVNLTLLPSTSSMLPFFSFGNELTVIYYAVIGLYLSVYRNSNLVKEVKAKKIEIT